MSTRLRMPFALLAASVLVLFSSGSALADPGDPTDAEVTEILESLPGTTTSGSADTSGSSSAARTTGAAERTAADFAAAEATVTLTQITTITLTQPGGTTTATATSTGGTTTSTSAGSTTSTSQNPGECVAGVIQDLIEDLIALGPSAPPAPGPLQAQLQALDPGDLPGIEDLLEGIGVSPEDFETGQRLIENAIEDIQDCFPTPPTGGGTQGPRPSQASGHYTPPTTHQPAFTYKDCDEARAYGAAPVYAGQYGYGTHLDSDYDGVGCEETVATYAQPVAYAGTGKLAYTGVSVQPLVAWGAALALSGSWLIASGRRRA
ncbi:excalibur calcium-binding domain-containing protein [Blastococcus litoris]|uniref:excalibur calcium-binding domain-containing protein n=1 Tax=Blastococcus litoris TaxID=2171622 RepID=UPI001F144F2F|nr:excalibur calcium-binding domain-containing protein [Blastococcus litoris]